MNPTRTRPGGGNTEFSEKVRFDISTFPLYKYCHIDHVLLHQGSFQPFAASPAYRGLATVALCRCKTAGNAGRTVNDRPFGISPAHLHYCKGLVSYFHRVEANLSLVQSRRTVRSNASFTIFAPRQYHPRLAKSVLNQNPIQNRILTQAMQRRSSNRTRRVSLGVALTGC